MTLGVFLTPLTVGAHAVVIAGHFSGKALEDLPAPAPERVDFSDTYTVKVAR